LGFFAFYGDLLEPRRRKMLAIRSLKQTIAKHSAVYANQFGVDSKIDKGERITCISLTCCDGSSIFAVKKRSGDVMYFPPEPFKTFNNFKEGM
jgi:hypothetical protein